MAEIVLRIRLVSGDHLDVRYEEPDTASDDEVIDHAAAALAAPDGMLRCQHGDRLLILYGRGVSAIEIAPRGAVL